MSVGGDESAWKPMAQEQTPNFLSIQEEQTKTLRDIVAQMNQAKNQNTANMNSGVNIRASAEVKEVKKDDKHQFHQKEQAPQQYHNQQKEAVWSGVNSMTPSAKPPNQESCERPSGQKKDKRQYQPKQHQSTQPSKQSQPSYQQSNKTSVWKTTSTETKSFADIQKEEELERLSQKHEQNPIPHTHSRPSSETPWAVPKGTDSSLSLHEIQQSETKTRANNESEVKKSQHGATQRKQQYNEEQNSSMKQQYEDPGQAVLSSSKQRPHQYKQGNTGNRKNIKPSK
jgi:hypothetical protein